MQRELPKPLLHARRPLAADPTRRLLARRVGEGGRLEVPNTRQTHRCPIQHHGHAGVPGLLRDP